MDSGTGQTMGRANVTLTVSLSMAEDLLVFPTIVLGTNNGCFLLASDLVDSSAQVDSADVSTIIMIEERKQIINN